MQPQEPPAGDVEQDVEQAVEKAMAGTESLDSVPLAEHVARFDAVHVALNDALSRIDSD